MKWDGRSLNCLFCGSHGPFTKTEHPIPESLGNDDLILEAGIVCDKCNQYFGSKIESPVLNSPPFNVERVRCAVKTKKNKYAQFVSQDVSFFSSGYWDHVIFCGSSDWYNETFISPDGGRFVAVQPPNYRSTLCRFLLKVGIELLSLSTSEDPFSAMYYRAKECARYGRWQDKWQIAYGQYPRRHDLIISTRSDGVDNFEKRQLYHYEIGAMPSGDVVFFSCSQHTALHVIYPISISMNTQNISTESMNLKWAYYREKACIADSSLQIRSTPQRRET